jgi:exodeoxyribonuclease VII large subunit
MEIEDHPLLASLFVVEEERQPQTVSELNSEIKAALESRFASVWVEGEISGFMAASSGHWYFKLTDGGSFLKAVCFKGQNYRVRFKPSDGIQVRVRGRITTYDARGEYQLVVESLEPVGEGALLVAFEQIKAKLAGEGLFDEALKRRLPPFPRRIGIITSPTGAALHDILTVLKRRARMVNVVLIPTQVQGETAGEQIARAIATVNEYCGGCLEHEKIDVLIVGRGGGSAEDLWAFNEERVARAIRASSIPVISAVGHEVDFTIADFVADLRAATPSAAAELVAQAETELCERIDRRFGKLKDLMSMRMLNLRNEVQSLALSRVFSDFPARVSGLRFRVDQASFNAESAMNSTVRKDLELLRSISTRLTPIGLAAKVSDNKKRLALLEQRSATAASVMTESRHRELERAVAKLDALSPLSVLTRGYSLTQKENGEIVRDTHQTQTGDRLTVRLAKGELGVKVEEVRKV